MSITLTSEAGGVGGKSGLYLIEGNGLPIISKIKDGYQIALPGDSIDTAYAGQNSRQGRVGHGVAHTLTTSSTQAYYFIDMNPNPKITELARCITTRQDSGIGKHKGEHSAVFVECLYTLDMNDEEKFALIYFDKNGDYHIGRIRKLTPRECWRLQGFTDEQFDRAAAKGLSDSKLYKMAGNAVTVPVISAVGQIIKLAQECGEKKIEDCVVVHAETAIPQINVPTYQSMADFVRLNAIAKAYTAMSEQQRMTFKAVLQREKPPTLDDVIDRARNISDYEIETFACTEPDFFKLYLMHFADSRLDSDWIAVLKKKTTVI